MASNVLLTGTITSHYCVISYTSITSIQEMVEWTVLVTSDKTMVLYTGVTYTIARKNFPL